jgi:hypothetical protein
MPNPFGKENKISGWLAAVAKGAAHGLADASRRRHELAGCC